MAREQNDNATAKALYEESLALRRELGDQWGIGAALNNLGLVVLHDGDYPAARALYGESLKVFRDLGNRQAMAILWNPNAAIEERRTQAIAAAGAFGIAPLVIEVRDLDGIVAAFAVMRKERANALFVVTDPLTLQNRNEIVRLAAANRIPAVYEFGEFVRAGGLVAYAPSITEQFRRAAIYVDKILHGAKPGELPIEQPTKFELVINLKTAKALGITVPKEMLLRADEVIQ